MSEHSFNCIAHLSIFIWGLNPYKEDETHKNALFRQLRVEKMRKILADIGITGLSIDVEGRLRDSDNRLDLREAGNYFNKALEMFSKPERSRHENVYDNRGNVCE